jgi:hypothetical protein
VGVRPTVCLSFQAGEHGDAGCEAARYAHAMSPASDNPALSSLRRALLSEVEAILNASKLSQVKP